MSLLSSYIIIGLILMYGFVRVLRFPPPIKLTVTI